MPRAASIPTWASLITLFVAVPALAAWPNQPNLNLAVATAARDQYSFAMIADGAGGAILAWQDTSGTSWDIRAQHVQASGTIDPAWPAGGTLLCAAPGDQMLPDLVSDGAGGAIVSWYDLRSEVDGDLYAQHVLASGAVDSAWPSNGVALCAASGDQLGHAPAGGVQCLVSDGAGGAIATWRDSRMPGADIYAQRVMASGAIAPGWPADGTAICTAAGGQSAPSLVPDGAGGAIISWHDSRAGNLDIYSHHVHATGAVDPSWPANGAVVCAAANDQRYPEGVPDGAGGVFVTWHDRRNGTDFDVYAHHVLASGVMDPAWPTNGAGVCAAAGDQTRRHLVPDGAGGALVTWHDKRDGVNSAVYAHHLLASGPDPAWPSNGLAVWVATGEVTSGSVSYRGIVSDGAGGAILAWQDYRSGTTWDVYAQRVLSSGSFDPSWSAAGRPVSTATGDQQGPGSVSDGAGGAIVAWIDRRNGIDYDIYAQRIQRSGALGGTTLTDIGAGLAVQYRSSIAWGDYDSDGDLDLLIAGTDGAGPRCYLYRNDAGTFVDAVAGLPGIELGKVAWADYDADGDLDIALAGWNGTPGIARIFRNNSGTFTDIGAGLPGVAAATVAWGDYDNDGDLDLLLAGEDNSLTKITRLYRNDAGTFVDAGAALTGMFYCDADWGDWDGDGDLDLIMVGNDGSGRLTRLYRNDGGTLVDSGAALPGLEGSAEWGDYDADGDLDLLLAGWTGSVRVCAVYRNTGGVLTDIGAGLPGLSSSEAAWGDDDNDGDLDIVAAGYANFGGGDAHVYRNDGGTFVEGGANLPSTYYSAVAWGDYDADGDLDLAYGGFYMATRIYRNDGSPGNAPPSAPANLNAVRSGNQLTFSWTPASDDHTSGAGLSYNLRVGTSAGAGGVMSPMAVGSGLRKVVRLGNAQERLSWTLNLPPGNYCWSVQAIDGAFQGSAFATEACVSVGCFTQFGAESPIDIGLPGLYAGAAAWGDYDNDGDLDVLLTGSRAGGYIARIYQNTPAGFAQMEGWPGVINGAVAWGDYDGDGDLDFALSGTNELSAAVCVVYRNDAGVFSDIGAGFPGVTSGSVAWGDYDKDGDLDLLVAGIDASPSFVSRIYRNDSGTFVDAAAGLPGAQVAVWGDYDHDGDLDIALLGPFSYLYRNDSGSFVNSGTILSRCDNGSAAWGDYDADGDLDLLVAGHDGVDSYTRIYRNAGGSLTDSGAALPGVYQSSVAWGDYDNDGDLDVLLAGWDGSTVMTRVYRNDGATFTDPLFGLPPVVAASVAWGDFEGDGDLDFLLTGSGIARVYLNRCAPANTAPSTPANLSAVRNGSLVTFSWTAASDDHTPASGLSYNLHVGTTPGGGQVMAGMAAANGYRRVPRLGNAQERLSWTLALPPGGYYWSVQAIDGAFLGSPFQQSTVAVEDAPRLPAAFELRPAGPNPFASGTAITYALPRGSHVELSVFDLSGRRVRGLTRGDRPAGTHTVRGDGRDDVGIVQPSGIYVVRLAAAERTWTRKLVRAR